MMSVSSSIEGRRHAALVQHVAQRYYALLLYHIRKALQTLFFKDLLRHKFHSF
jgi:hypothetical protein